MATKTKDKAQTSAPETYTCAMDKIRDEMARGKGRYVQVVGEYLSDYLLRHPEAEGKLMAKGKSIAGSLQAMRDEAEKVKDGNVAVLDDQTAFGIVLRYFGIESGATADAGTSSAPPRCRARFAESTDGSFAKGETDKPLGLSPCGGTFPRGEGFWAGGATPPLQREGEPREKTASAEPDPFDLDALMGGL